MDKVKRYSAEEKKAYYMGVGAYIGYGKAIKTVASRMSSQAKQSFYNGFDSATQKYAGVKKKGKF